ncbi:MAG: cation:proton antiporter [Oscillospiraceae bacterium]|nr:cation:proton antiporter [Oscillospiraceae bacterium]MCI7498211.1 cation:proton antiporter [Oscillospiraceae bacterium]MDD7279787.1 cation:proton antiporter [Oscillospiraceae bacterium]MDY2863033.1 cation:proton antiporter [Oscillospiraceae bacterium]
MEDYSYLLSIALILISTKVLGLFSKKIKLPQVVGALIAGVIMGPACLGWIHNTEMLSCLSEIGVIVLMFAAGLETDINELKRTGKASFLIALIGVIVPLLGGAAAAYFFNDSVDGNKMLQNIFIGIILTATSVSITVETLKEMGKLSTPAGNAILGAAIIDDILGIIALTMVISMADSSVSIGMVLLKILGFFVFTFVAAVGYHYAFKKWTDNNPVKLRRYVVISFAFCLVLAYCAEEFFGVADITGAFFAGLAISGTNKADYVTKRFDTLSYLLLSPIFFASIGLKVVLPKMNLEIVLFTVIICLVAVLTKVIGCGLGAKICKYSNKESLQIGVGMISRGEVALIVANKGEAVGLMSDKFFAPIVIMVVLTTIITPVLLKVVFKDKNDAGKVEEKEPAVAAK